MILRELFYADPDSKAISQDMEYNGRNDKSIMKRNDTRKTRLSLGQLNQLRKTSDTHIVEQEKELEFIQKMYDIPAPPA